MADLRVEYDPLHLRTQRKMRELIDSGFFARGQKLPPESRLKEMLGVSRATLREALKALQQEGLVVQRQGIGTFVNERLLSIRSGLEEMRGVTEMLEDLGLRADRSAMEFRSETASAEAAKALGLSSGAPVWVVKRVRTANGIPVVYSINEMDRQLLGEHIHELEHYHSLAALLRDRCGREPGHAVANILPVPSPGQIARIMGIDRRTPFLLMEQVLYDSRHGPYLYCLDYYRCDIFKFHVIRRRK